MKKFLNVKFYSKLLVAILVIYSVVGFIILPYFIKFYFPTIIKKTIHSESYVDSVHLNPFTFDIKIQSLMIKDQKDQNLLFVEKLNLNIDPFDLFLNKLQISELLIDNLKLSVAIEKNKVANFQYIIDNLNKNSTSKPTTTKNSDNFTLNIAKLDLLNIHFSFKDYSKKELFEVDTKPINLSTTDIQLKSNHTNKFDFAIDTHQIGDIALQSDLIVNPLSIDGKIKLSNIAVNEIFHYIKPDNLTFDIDSSRLNLSFDYQYLQNNKAQNINLENIALQLEKFSYLSDPFVVNLVDFKNNTKNLKLQRDHNIFYQVANIKTTIKNINFQDKTKNSSLDFNNFTNQTETITDNKKESIKSIQTLNTPQSGTITANIEATQKPLQLDIQLTTKDIAINPYEPYLKEFANLNIISGTLSNDATINIKEKNNKATIALATNTTLNKIDIKNSTNQQQLLKVKTLDIRDLKYQDDSLFIKNITIEKPFIYFALNDNNTTNFSNITPIQEEKTKTDTDTKKTKEFLYDIETISIKDGDALFEDSTVLPKFISKDTQISANIKNLSSDKNKQTTITHTSTIDKYAPLLANATLLISNPTQALNSNIKVENIDLRSLSSYSAKYIGQKISNGKLTLTLDTDIKNSHLTSKNHIKIKDIKLGKKVESKDAIDAPIELAIALLEDSDGYIDLDIPITGDINDPKFDISDAIFDVIRNTIVGIVSAPFKFLALMLGVEANDISHLEFEYGDTTITPTQKENLDNIVKAFTKRPHLILQIQTSYTKEQDSIALQEQRFQKLYPQLVLSDDKELEDIFQKTETIFIKTLGKNSYKKLKGEKKEIYQTMVSKLKENIAISQEELDTLAKKRANNIKNYLTKKKLNPSKIIIDETILSGRKDSKLDKAVVKFQIKTD